MPFITEEIWQRVGAARGRRRRLDHAPALSRPRLPDAAATPRSSPRCAGSWTSSSACAASAANSTSRRRVPLAAAPAERGAGGPRALRAQRSRHLSASPASPRRRRSPPGEQAPQAAAALLGELRILVPMAGLIDVEAELARLGKRRGKVEQELATRERQARQRELRPQCAGRGRRPRSASGCEGFKRELAQLAEQHERVASLR